MYWQADASVLQYTHVKKLTMFFKNKMYKSSYTHAHKGVGHADMVGS